MAGEIKAKKNWFSSLSFMLVSILVFIIVYSAIFFILNSNLQKEYDSANQLIPIVKTGLSDPSEFTKYFDQYAWLGGIIFGIIALICILLLYAIFSALKLTRLSFMPGIILCFAYGLLFAIAFILVFLEKAYVPWANGVIFFLGHPLLYSTILMILFSGGSIYLARGNAK